MKKKVLPINEKPSIITCIHHAYPCAIIESKELADLEICNSCESVWKTKENNCTLYFEKSEIKVFEIDNKIGSSAVIWRECGENDEIIVGINHLKPRDVSRYIDVFVFDDCLEKEILLEDKTCGIRWNPYGFFVGKDMYNYDTRVFKYIRFQRRKDSISFDVSKDGSDWIGVEQRDIETTDKLNVGIHLNFGNDYFDVWKKMNFIQLIYNEEDPYKGIHLDYYFFPRKNIDNSYSFFVNFIDTHYDSLYDAVDCFGSISEYIHWNIDHNYYLNICLDEFYIKDRLNFSLTHYNHYNLFYGYNDEKEVYYVMGYGKTGKPVVSEISYEVLSTEIITSANIVRYKYSTNDVTRFKFNIDSLILNVYELLHSVDSDVKHANLMTGEKLQYGISILNKLASTEIQRMKEDIRISFCLNEHSKLMKERVMFLFEQGYLENRYYNDLLEKCDKMILVTSSLVSLILVNEYKEVEQQRIRDKLLGLYGIEEEFLEKLLKCLLENRRVSGCDNQLENFGLGSDIASS